MSAAGRPCRLRGAIATLGVAVTLAAAPAAGAERQAPTVTLAVAPEPARFAASVTFSGTISPAAPQPVTLFRQAGAELQPVASGTSGPDGSFAFRMLAGDPGTFVAQAAGATSPPVTLRLRPRIRLRVTRLPTVSTPMRVAGRVRPSVARAGRLSVTARGRSRTVRVGPDGRCRITIASRRSGRAGARLRLGPSQGFVRAACTLCEYVVTPPRARCSVAGVDLDPQMALVPPTVSRRDCAAALDG